MCNKRNTLIINFRSFLNVGGIETYLYDLSKYLVNNGGRVIWLCHNIPLVAKSFSDLMLSDKIERVAVKEGLYWYKCEKLNISDEENAIIVSFSPLTNSMAEKMWKKMGCPSNIYPLYIIANNVGEGYYLEENFKFFLKNYVKSKMCQICKRWEENNTIRFFALSHISSLEDKYGIKISNHQTKLLKSVDNFNPLDLSIIKIRASRDNFNIVTVGRFDFPHKGYMLGLVRSYGRLKRRFPKLNLTIIGYGPHEKELLAEISNIPIEYRSDIKIVGEVAPSDLVIYFNKAHLNVSVAGAASQGARYGLLTLPARNFCTGECEVYGYFSENALKTTSLCEGYLVDNFIEEVINMPDDEYIRRSVACYEALVKRDSNTSEPLYLFNSVSSLKSRASFCFSDTLFILFISYCIKVINRLACLLKIH